MDKVEQIVSWIKEIYGEKPAVVAVSGGVDSAVVLTLVTKALGVERVIPLCLPYHDQNMDDAKLIIEWNGLTQRMVTVNIGEATDVMAKAVGVGDNELRKGNIMVRMRMIALFDLAKATGSLVAGTENKSEHYLGYYTRFGDEASDVEPIRSLYKTQVWQLAHVLSLPVVFSTKAPSAGLWEGQTDEGEMGFDYSSADKVLRVLIDHEEDKGEVSREIFEKVAAVVAANAFKREVPYVN